MSHDIDYTHIDTHQIDLRIDLNTMTFFRRCVESLESYRFPGRSLLLIFDGAAWERLDECNVNEDNVEELTRWLHLDNLVSIKMVDFAKGRPPGITIT